jgi:hypothetical protein
MVVDASKIQINPGGTLTPEQTWNYDDLIAEISEALQVQSVYFTGERRMGKTSVGKKMRAVAMKTLRTVYLDVESIRTAEDFTKALYAEVMRESPLKTQLLAKTLDISRRVRKVSATELSVEFGTLADKNWTVALEALIRAANSDDKALVLCLDELPQMLSNIASQGDPSAARNVLDLLRQFRQTNERVRFIYTGSVGLHHVERELQELGAAWAPTNDMRQIDIPPFQLAEAQALATALLNNASIPTSSAIDVAARIAKLSEGIPYYVHGLASRLRSLRRTVEPDDVDRVLVSAIEDPDDPFDLRHYITRINEYYGADAPTVLGVLDVVALNDQITFDTIHKLLSTRGVDGVDREDLLRLVELLQRDHYLSSEQGAFTFRRRIVAQAWRVRRHLS